MELIIAAAIGGVLFGILLWKLIWNIVSPATENLLDWLIHNLGNERAAKRIEEKWQAKEASDAEVGHSSSSPRD